MLELLRRLFGGAAPSAIAAKERLRLVLMTDHLALAPEIIDAMKRDLVDVISRHVEVDRERIEVTFERQDRAVAMLANIPILSVNRPSPPDRPQPPPVRPRRKRARRRAESAVTPAEPAPAT
ncbi:MAG TPA: cell division topological specificity factor MinE [Candidatus Tyrphobacter sp.]